MPERKPSALPLKTMMKQAGHEPHNTIMIGDGIPDMVSAQNASVASIAIEFGYTNPEILKKYNPHGILGHYNDLNSLIRQIYKPQ